ncbi:single-stranded DNA-binding protein [Salipaludibacillus agaradhaerens]|uniref:single-stranded DNA-binding protein n=1 Tax=Salipaludibacillus agaradhaerens TaxID=76935 RepID=UPI0009979772|nr:single-stranded DNA-binding protein [Salipaludibacillus agaradhaerens]
MLNQFTLIGRIARQPSLQTTREGISYTRFTLAVRRHFKNQAGQYDTDFVQLISWNKVAERIADFCSKGSLVSVNGRIQMRSFEVEKEKRLTVPDVVAENVTFLQMKKMTDGTPSHEKVPIPSPPLPSSEEESPSN